MLIWGSYVLLRLLSLPAFMWLVGMDGGAMSEGEERILFTVAQCIQFPISYKQILVRISSEVIGSIYSLTVINICMSRLSLCCVDDVPAANILFQFRSGAAGTKLQPHICT